MIEQDTIKLLRECDAGIKMGVLSLDQVLVYAKDKKLKEFLKESKEEHNKLDEEVQQQLERFDDEGKKPSSMAKGMSWMKTNVMLIVNESDNMIADIIIDGCDMGVKSLSKYLNQYAAADEFSKDICKKLISLEEKLGIQMREYL